MNRYAFLIDTYSTERLKILGVWAMVRDDEMILAAGAPRTQCA
jgi:hypothetical protein